MSNMAIEWDNVKLEGHKMKLLSTMLLSEDGELFIRLPEQEFVKIAELNVEEERLLRQLVLGK